MLVYTWRLVIDREAREIMYLVASVRPSVRPSVRRPSVRPFVRPSVNLGADSLLIPICL